MAFGYSQAMINRDINSLYDLITGVTPTLKAYERVGGSGDFYHRTAFLELNDLALAATVCSPMTYEVAEDRHLYFIFPMHGEARARSQRRDYCVSPSLGAAIMPGHDRKGSMSEMSMLQATLKPERFKSTAITMIGTSCERQIEDRLERPQVLAMRPGHLRFDRLFPSICKTIDDCALQSPTLNALGFEDLFYRTVITMVFPELLLAPSTASPTFASVAPLDRVCDYIDAHLTEAIYLTELEAISQLSTRSLQYAFLRRFGCSPTTWIRQRRLDLAHRRLMRAAPSETVTSIALDCGFSNPSDFARLYSKTYGVSPRLTLRGAADSAS